MDKIIYSDLDLGFIAHPLTLDIVQKTNEDAIHRTLLNIFSLEKYDIPFNGSFYVGMREVLFDNITRLSASSLESRIEWAIKKYEKRIKLEKVEVRENLQENGYDVRVEYIIKTLGKRDEVSFFFQRIR